MSDPTPEALADDPNVPPETKDGSAEDNAMAAVDAALAPAIGALKANAGLVHSSTLVHVLGCVRQTLAHAIYGAPDPAEVNGESLDVAGLQRRNGDAYRAYVEQCKADGVEPDDLPTFVNNQARDEAEIAPGSAAALNGEDAAKASAANQSMTAEWASMTSAARTAAWASDSEGLGLAGIVDPDGQGGANNSTNVAPVTADKLFA